MHWHFAEAGDTHRGRIFAGLDGNNERFTVLPPHFFADNPMADEDIKEGMHLCFGTVLKLCGGTVSDPTA